MRKSARAGSLVLVIAMAIMWSGAMSAGAAPADQVLVVNGTIAPVNGSSLTIAPASGAEKVVKIEPETLILLRCGIVYHSAIPKQSKRPTPSSPSRARIPRGY